MLVVLCVLYGVFVCVGCFGVYYIFAKTGREVSRKMMKKFVSD
jgi:hypothetical protein